MAIQNLINNRSNWKLVEQHSAVRRVWGGAWSLTPYFYEEQTAVWEIHLADGATAPGSAVNPGGYETGAVTLDDGTSTAGYSWYCCDRCMTRDYSSPLSTVYRETWARRTETEEM